MDYKQALKNYNKKFDFARKFNEDNNLEYGDEGFMDWVDMATDFEREVSRLETELNVTWMYAINKNCGIETKDLSEYSKNFISSESDKKDRIEFMISVLRKALKTFKHIQ